MDAESTEITEGYYWATYLGVEREIVRVVSYKSFAGELLGVIRFWCQSPEPLTNYSDWEKIEPTSTKNCC